MFVIDLRGLRLCAFYCVFKSNRDCFNATDPSRVSLLKCELKAFKRATNSRHKSTLSLDWGNLIEHKSFLRAWEPFTTCCLNLMNFCDGLGSTLFGAATIKGVFSVLHWEVNKYRSSIYKSNVQGVFRCKQHKELEGIILNKAILVVWKCCPATASFKLALKFRNRRKVWFQKIVTPIVK